MLNLLYDNLIAKHANNDACFLNQAGGIVLSLNTDYRKDGISYFIKDASPKIFVCDPQKRKELEDISDQVVSQVFTMDEDRRGSLQSQANIL